jgi:sulfopyruvate decarboxylase alpha subunit
MPIPAKTIVAGLQEVGCNFFTGVPDSVLSGVIAALIERRLYVPAVREDEAVAMAAGAFMGGRIPVVLMQNSGLGTSLNALISLNLIYLQPCLLMISWRGQDGKDAPEHVVMGQVLPNLLDLVRIPHRTLTADNYQKDLQWAAQILTKQRIPAALLVGKGILS